MTPPPFLLLATLLFWGWQSDQPGQANFLMIGGALGVILESARGIKMRWDLADEDFGRIWNFSILLILTLGVYIFSTDENGGLGSLIHVADNVKNVNAATASIANAGTTTLRWLPMTLFLLIAAQTFSIRGKVTLSVISWVFRRRLKRGLGETVINLSYPYFILCLFSAGIHPNTGTLSYFFGLGGLLGWALWAVRSRRYRVVLWLGLLVASLAGGLASARGMGLAQHWIEGGAISWMQRLMQPKTSPLQTETAIGQIGRMKLSGKIVIRLTPKDGSRAPEYLREASYRIYRSQHWLAGSQGSNFDPIAEQSDQTSWVLVPNQTNVSVASMASYLNGYNKELSFPEGLLPLPSGCDRLEKYQAVALKKNALGAVLAAGPGLAMFDARFGLGPTLDSSPELNATNQFDLNVPTNEIPALKQVLAEMHLPATAGSDEKRHAIQGFFAAKFNYSTWLGPGKTPLTNNETPLAHFLLANRKGHCEYFATATVLLLRELNIPARYAVGYVVHEPAGKGYVVRGRDAHAWCLVWNDARHQWEDFDTTPASWVAAEGQRADFTEKLSDAWSWLKYQFAKFRWGQSFVRRYIFFALIPVLAFLLYRIIFRRRKRRARLETKVAAKIFWPGLDSEFYQLEALLANRGVPRQIGEPLSEWMTRALAEPALAHLRAPLQQLLRLHYRLRFDPEGLSAAEREQLARDVQAQMKILAELTVK